MFLRLNRQEIQQLYDHLEYQYAAGDMVEVIRKLRSYLDTEPQMICILAGDILEAERWARGQELRRDEYFCASSLEDLSDKKDFHVIVVGTVQNMPTSYFNKLYALALQRGRMNRL